MQPVLPPFATAPITTGHPLGLPQRNEVPTHRDRVAAISKSDAAALQHRSPTAFWRGLSGEPDPDTHVPPPSIMQIRIETMLGEKIADSGAAADARAAPIAAYGMFSDPERRLLSATI